MQNHVLVLNASYEFLNVATLPRALKLVFKGKAEVLEVYPDLDIRGGSISIKAPLIIRMLYFVVRPFKNTPLTKKNVLKRDKLTCQYCGKPGRTIDHVVPKSRGGKDSWENCVCACSACNTRKNNRTPQEAGMKLLSKPKQPSFIGWVVFTSEINLPLWQKYL